MDRAIKVGKFAECTRGHTWLVLKIDGDRVKVESVVTKEVYWAPLADLTGALMIEETL